MRALAAFATSDVGRLYGQVCERWGLDPGAVFSDDVMAVNARVAFAQVLAGGSEELEPDSHAELVAKSQAGGERILRALRG